MPNRAATDAALNPKRGAPKRATGQQIAFLLVCIFFFILGSDNFTNFIIVGIILYRLFFYFSCVFI